MLDDLQEQVNNFARILGLPVSLTTPDLDSVVFSPHTGIIDDVRAHSILSRGTEDWVVKWFRHAGVGSGTAPTLVPAFPERQALARWVVPVHAGEKIFGYLCILDPNGECNAADLDRVSDKVAEIARTIAAAEEANRMTSRQLRIFLTGEEDERETAYAKLIDRHGKPGSPSRIVTGTSITGGSGKPRLPGEGNSARKGQTAWTADGGVIECRFEDHHAFLVPGTGVPMAVLAHLMPCCPSPVMGAGNLSQTPKELLRSYGQALAAMRFSALDRYQGGVAYWADMGPSKVLAVLDRGTLEDIIDPRVASLAEEDPELLLTVAQHLENVNRPAATADALHIHRGTLYYRLKKFEAHTGLDLDKGSDRLSVQLSLLARHIRNGPKLGHTGG